MEECLHRELVFGSGDYYIVCANWRCARRWAAINSKDEVSPEGTNKGKQAYLSGHRRTERPVDDGK